jgi:hypothetical protein
MRLAHLNLTLLLTALVFYLGTIMVKPNGFVLVIARLGVVCLVAEAVLPVVGIGIPVP